MYQHGQVIRGHLTVVSQPYRGHGLHEGRRWPLHCWAGEALLSPVPGVEGVLLVHPPVSGLGVVLVAVHDGQVQRFSANPLLASKCVISL